MIYGAANRTWTGTGFTPRDFKFLNRWSVLISFVVFCSLLCPIFRAFWVSKIEKHRITAAFKNHKKPCFLVDFR